MRRNPTYHIHLFLALSLGLAMLFMLVGMDRRENFYVCKVFAVLIHYMYVKVRGLMNKFGCFLANYASRSKRPQKEVSIWDLCDRNNCRE